MATAVLSASAPVRAPTQLAVRPVSVLVVALTLLVVGNLGRIPLMDLGARQAPLLINDLCVAAVLVTGFLMSVNRRSLRLNDVALTALAFAAIGGISAVAAVPRFGLSGMELIASLAYLARWGFYFAIYLVVINCVRAGDAHRVWSAAERALLLMAAFGVIQSVFLPDFAFLVYPEARKFIDWDVQGNRLVSTILEPNLMAAMLVIVLLVHLSRLACGVKDTLWKPLLLIGALVLTLSRSGALAFLVGGFVILVATGLRKSLVRIVGVIAVLMLAALPKIIEFGSRFSKFQIDESALARGVELAVQHPWFGVGFNTYGFVQEHRGIERLGSSSYATEGGLLFIAVMTGIVGVAFYVTMLALILRRCRATWRDLRATPEERGLLLGTGATTIAILVHTAFVNSLLFPFVMELLWVLWGLSFVVAVDIRRRPVLEAAPIEALMTARSG
jgi:O-antigen ligase